MMPRPRPRLTAISMVLMTFLLAATSPTAAFTPMLAHDIMKQAFSGPYTAVDPANVSADCTKAVDELISNPTELIYVADAMGKPAAGALVGNTAWIGHYDECKSIKDFRYCTTQMILDGTTISPTLRVPVSWGVCAPKVCSNADISNGIDKLAELAKIDQYFYHNVNSSYTVCAEDPAVPYDAGFICTVAFCSVMILLAVYSALFNEALKFQWRKFLLFPFRLQSDDTFESTHHRDVEDDDVPLIGSQGNIGNEEVQLKQTGQQSILARIIQCFSVTRNLSKLVDSKQTDRGISCANGIRVISMFWVILGHTFAFASYGGAVVNPLNAYSFLDRFGFQAILNATFSVDSFFFLSGFLVGLLTFMRMAKTDGKIPWFWFYFHRFWRLTPVYMFTILVAMYLTPYFGMGPFWQNIAGALRGACSNYWWTNLLYINNFWPKDFGGECIAWSWYLANDMQFFIISPIFLVSLFMFPIVGVVLLQSTLVGSFIVTGLLIWYYDLPVLMSKNSIDPSQNPQPPLDYNSVVYGKPYCRIAPYLVGIALGYILHRIGNKKVIMNPIIAAIGWAMAAGVAISLLYGNYPSLHGGYVSSMAANIIYGSVSRFAWALVLAWIIFACKYGYGGWVNNFLSWSGWIILSRLTYTAYLVHPIVIFCFYFNFGTAMYFSIIVLAFYFVGILGISYGVAAIFALVIEYPFANLEKLFMPQDVQSKRQVESSSSRENIIQ